MHHIKPGNVAWRSKSQGMWSKSESCRDLSSRSQLRTHRLPSVSTEPQPSLFKGRPFFPPIFTINHGCFVIVWQEKSPSEHLLLLHLYVSKQFFNRVQSHSCHISIKSITLSIYLTVLKTF